MASSSFSGQSSLPAAGDALLLLTTPKPNFAPQGGFGGLVFAKLSKLLNQENALSAPCLPHFDFCSPQAPGRGAEMLRTGVIRRFRCHISICYTRVNHADKRDALQVVGGRCTGRARRCKAKQGRPDKNGAGVWILSYTLIRFLLCVQSGRKFIW